VSDLSQPRYGGAASGFWRGLVPAVLLVAFNLIPLAGVLWFGWDLFSILVLYWLESGVIGVVNVLRIARAEGEAPSGTSRVTLRGRAGGNAPRGCLVPFFVLHYGIFWVVHGVFVFLMPVFAVMGGMFSGRRPEVPRTTLTYEGIVLALVALTAFHLLSYWFDYIGRGEYLRTSPGAQMFRPYGRVVVLHLTILVGAFLLFASGQPILLVALMVVLKTVIDLALFVVGQRGQAGGQPAG
jgi:hypothetical protein